MDMARTPKVVEDRREQILDAAMRVFAQKGFARATNKDIAREAGITPGLIYYYFESKEAVFKEIIESRSPIHLLGTLSEQVLALPPQTFLPLLLRQVLAIVEGENFVGLIRVLLPELIHNDSPYLAETASSIFQRVTNFLARYFETQSALGELRDIDPAATTQVLLGSVIGFVLRRQIIRDASVLALTHEQIADIVSSTLLQGILPGKYA